MHARLTFDSFSNKQKEEKLSAKPISRKKIAAISATITTSTTLVCKGSKSPTITFTGLGGTAPYTFTYTINGGPALTAKTIGSKSTIAITVPTTTANVFIYKLVSVKDAIDTKTENGSVTIHVNDVPDVDFTFNNDDSCSGTTIEFTDATTGGSGNYSYFWDFGNGDNSTLQNPVYTFNELGCGIKVETVKLTITDGNCIMMKTKTINVKQKPDIDFIDKSPNATRTTQFNNCANASISSTSYAITVGNTSLTTCASSYSINWGDGVIEDNIIFPANHTYVNQGVFSMIISATGTNGCVNSKNYLVKNMGNPSGGILSPGGTTDMCTPTPIIQYSIGVWATNSPGTTYSVDYGDGYVLKLSQDDMIKTPYFNAANPAASDNYPVPYSYKTTSCPKKNFTIRLTVSNACKTTVGSIESGNTISTVQPNFTAPAAACTNNDVLFTNTSILGRSGDCLSDTNFIWNFGDPASGASNIINSGFVSTATNANHTFSGPGTYTVTLTATSDGPCAGYPPKTQTICISSAMPAPTISLTPSNSSNCAPLTVNATTPNVITNCILPIEYSWIVTKKSTDCDILASDPTFSNSTTSTSQNPVFNFNDPGEYSISLKTKSSCGELQSAIQTLIVRKPPKVEVTPIANLCEGPAGTTIIQPTATVKNCGFTNSELIYNWSFPGGTPSTSNVRAPQVTYTTGGTKTVSLYISTADGCGESATSSQTFIISNPSTQGALIDPQPLQSQNICVGSTLTTPLYSNFISGTGTASYQWYKNATDSNIGGTLIAGATDPTYTPPVFNAPETAYYYLTISFRGNGCGSISCDPAEVKVFADPTITSILPPTQSVCAGATPANFTVLAAGESSLGDLKYQWYSNTVNSNSDGNLILNATNSTFSPPTSGTASMYYYCVVSQALGCESTSSTVNVTIIPGAEISQQPQSSTFCLGGTPTLLEVAYKNGAGTPQYQWYSNTTNTIVGSVSISDATSSTFAPPNTTVGSTFYYCKITLPGGGCSELISDFAEVIINQSPVISNKTETICSGKTFTQTPVNAGTDIIPPGTTYTWSSPVINPPNSITGASEQNIAQTEISQTLINTTTNPATVTYTVTPIVGVCIGATFTVTITVNEAISNRITLKNSTCFGKNNGSIQTNITGGIPFTSGAPYQISWTGPNGYTSTDSTISDLAPGKYNLTVIDDGGCQFSDTYNITEPSEIVITKDLGKDISCHNAADGKIEITVTGGTSNYVYTWTKDGNPFSNAEDITNLSQGSYAVSVTDANNCTSKTETFTITEPQILAVSLVSKTDITCFGASTGAINISSTGGTPLEISSGVFKYQYAWTGPNGFASSNQNLNNIPAGTYDLKVTDNSGCSNVLSVTLDQNTEIKIDANVIPLKCFGNNNASISVNISGGTAPYDVSWSNFSKGLFLDNLSAGDYTVTVIDALGCSKSLLINITEVPKFNITPIVKHVSCFGAKDGSINLQLVGGTAPVSLVWTDNPLAGMIRNNLQAGTYVVKIIDKNLCTIDQTFTILEPKLLVLSADVTDANNCNDASSGAINLIVAGGTPPFTYAWSNGATTKDLLNITTGAYIVKVTDANGCSQQEKYSINRPLPIVPSVDNKTEYDCDNNFIKQSFIANISGGVPPYLLSWSSGKVSGANNEIMNTNKNGTVILNISDAVGCKSNYSFNVTLPVFSAPPFTITSFAYTNFGSYSINDPIQFTNEATGAITGMLWDFGDGTTSTDSNPLHTFVNPKEYEVTQTVTYAFGCLTSKNKLINVDKGYVLVVPTAFTPNNDGVNDTFKPVTKGLKNVRLDVYDTWGSLIYSEQGDALRGWDGKIKNSNAENGNYYYKVSGETFYGTVVNENQPFVIIK